MTAASLMWLLIRIGGFNKQRLFRFRVWASRPEADLFIRSAALRDVFLQTSHPNGERRSVG